MKATFTKDNIILKSNPQRYSILQAVKNFSEMIDDELVISIGDGPSHYRSLFQNYIGFDIERDNKNIDFVADAYNIPIKSNSIGAIISIEVLEHLRHPEKGISESYRVLGKGGRMLITVPLIGGLHDEPCDFFRYTPYSLKFMLENAGFEIISIKPKGGYFWVLANLSKKMRFHTPKFLSSIIYPLFSFLIPLVLFYMDRLDHEKKITLGYEILVIKK
jgi:SAM-dependent methyltransferase